MGFFSLCHHVQTGSGAHPASYPVGIGVLGYWELSDQGMKLTIHLLLVLSLRMQGAIPPLPQYFLAWCLGNLRSKISITEIAASCSPSSSCRWEDNIRMDLREIGWEGVNWFHLPQDRYQWQILLNS
jgi:hypothetical protein